MLVICGITFGCYLAAFMRLPVVPLQARVFGIDTARIGMINAAFFLMAGLLSFPLGMLTDRWGRKPMAAGGLLALAAASLGLYMCRHFIHFVAAYLLLGIGIAAFGPTMMTLVSVISSRSHLGRSYGWYTTALFCGMSLGPAVGGYLARFVGAPTVFLAAGAFLFLDLGLLIWLMPGRFQHAQSAGLTDERPGALRKLFHNRPLLGCWLITLGACFGLGMFTSFIPLHAQERGLEVSQIGIVFLAQGLCNGASRIPFGQLSDKVSRRSTLVILGILLYILALSGCGLARTMAHFILAASLLGISMGLAFTSVGALIAEAVPAAHRGSAMGGYNTCIYIGMMMSSWTMGMVSAIIGFAWGFYLTAAVNLIFLGGFGMLTKGFQSLGEASPS